jgi:Zn-finger domain-containing protein
MHIMCHSSAIEYIITPVTILQFHHKHGRIIEKHHTKKKYNYFKNKKKMKISSDLFLCKLSNILGRKRQAVVSTKCLYHGLRDGIHMHHAGAFRADKWDCLDQRRDWTELC